MKGQNPGKGQAYLASYTDSTGAWLFLGPTPPPCGETNWVQTLPGRHWFSYVRFYGPLQTYFDRTWGSGDITPV